MHELQAITVSQLNRYIASKLKSDEKLSGIMIRGEISNFTNHQKTGHWYFSVKDDSSALKAIMFKWSNERLQFVPENGMNVICYGDIQVYEAGGVYQLYVKDIIPDGLGSLNLAFEQLKTKLYEEGLFDEIYKKPIPKLPKRICVITAETGAALQDVLNILNRRCPIVNVTLIPTLVQGKNAPEEICKSIKLANEHNFDVIILCRGGGSLEDLWAFNDENVARTVFASNIPIISAVGHETDFTICDFVADLRAPTPSAAAELAVCDKETLINTLTFETDKIKRAILLKIADENAYIKELNSKLIANSPKGKTKENSRKLSELETKLKFLMDRKFVSRNNELIRNTELLSAFNPLSILSKGYSLTYKDDKIIKSADRVDVGDEIKIKFENSQITATVIERKF